MSSQKKSHMRGLNAWERDSHSTWFARTQSPRHIRVLQALLERGKLTREQLDDISGSSNGPDVVLKLRCKGLSIPCELVQRIDRDGRPCEAGIYRLTTKDQPCAVG